MSAYFAIETNRPGSDPLVLVDGPPFEPWVYTDKAIGDPVRTISYSGSRGGLGALPASSRMENREVTFQLRYDGEPDTDLTRDTLASRVEEISSVADELGRYGGWIITREHDQTHRQRFQVLAGSASVNGWSTRAYDARNIVGVFITAVCAPYVLWDPVDVYEPWASDTLTGSADWTFDASTAATLDLASGLWTPDGSLGTERRFVDARGYTYPDARVVLRVRTGSAVDVDSVWGVVLKRTGATTYLAVNLEPVTTGSSYRLRVQAVVAGSDETSADVTQDVGGYASAETLTADTDYWIDARLEGNAVVAELHGEDPYPGLTPLNGVLATFDGDTETALGRGVAGVAGVLIDPENATDAFGAVRIEPWTYDEAGHVAPADLPGNAPGLVTAHLSRAGTSPPVWGLLGWAPKPLAYNRVGNGDFAVDVDDWFDLSVVTTGSGAETSLVALTQAVSAGRPALVYAGDSPNVYTPGVITLASGPFRAGTSYTLNASVRSPADTDDYEVAIVEADPPPSVGDDFDVGSDFASSTAAALTSSWVDVSVEWTPSLDAEQVWLVVRGTENNDATVHVSRVEMVETADPPVISSQLEGRGGNPPIGRFYHAFGFANTAIDYEKSWVVDPNLIVPDDHSGSEIDVEAWVYFTRLDSGVTGMSAVLFAEPVVGDDYGARRYSREHGSTGRVVRAPSSGSNPRRSRLGVVSLPIDRTRPARWRVGFTLVHSGGAGTLRVGHLLLVPARSRVTGKTGVPLDSGYPRLFPSDEPLTRLILPDTSGGIVAPPSRSIYPAPGLGGSTTLEWPVGDVEVVVATDARVPDDPTLDAGSATDERPVVHLEVLPRSRYLRTV